MDNIIGFLSKCFGSVYPPVLEQFLEYVKDLDFQSDPDYEVSSVHRPVTNRSSGNRRHVHHLAPSHGQVPGQQTHLDKTQEEGKRKKERRPSFKDRGVDHGREQQWGCWKC